MTRDKVYADYAAATPTDPHVVAAMAPFFTKVFGNPSSAHSPGRSAFEAVELARVKIADFLHCLPEEAYVTSSGTESNNLALLGIARANRQHGNHIITSVIEHPSIINACRALERDGFQVTYLPVTKKGLVDPMALKRAITSKTILVSIHLANSELGVIQDVEKLSRITRGRHILFHTDACQAANFLELDVQKLGVDLLTFNGSKIYGPKGVAVLFVREGVTIFPIIYGGGQEKSLRSGTENVPAIIGLAKATELVQANQNKDVTRVGKLRDQLQGKLTKLPNLTINVATSPRLPNHLSVQIGQKNGRDLVRELDERGIAVSAGSACSSKSLTESYVLTAIGLTSDQANSSIRISLGRPSTKQQTDAIADVLKGLSTK